MTRVNREFKHAIEGKKKKKRPNPAPVPEAASYTGLHGRARARRVVAARSTPLPPIVGEIARRLRTQLRTHHQTVTACFRNFDTNADGSMSLDEMRRGCRFVKITGAGLRESHVHDVQIMRESPNYRLG